VNYFQVSSLGIFPFVTAIFPGNCEKNTNKLCKENADRAKKTKKYFLVEE